MATSVDTELSEFPINSVASDELLKEMESAGLLEENQIYMTPDKESMSISLPVGSIFASAIPLTDSRVHLLDGSTISQTGVYEEFATLIKNLIASGQPISCSQDDFDTDVANTGNCGKFVIDDGNGTIRLPKITTFIQGLDNISNIGSSLSAGLPNITGYVDVYTAYAATSYVTQQNGAMYTARNGDAEYFTSGRSSGSGWANRTGINANYSSDIYRDEVTTVQPNATQFPYYIVLASGYKSNQELNVDNLMNEINTVKNKGTKVLYTGVHGTYESTLTAYPGSPQTMLSGSFTKKSDTSKILIIADTYIIDASGGYSSQFKLDIDGSDAMIDTSNYTRQRAVTRAWSGYSSGEHTFKLYIECGYPSGTSHYTQIPSYILSNLVILEVEE